MRRRRGAIPLVNAVMALGVCLPLVAQTSRIQIHQAFSGVSGVVVTGTSATARLGPSAPFAWTLLQLSAGNLAAGLQELGLMAALVGLLFAACVALGSRLLSASAIAEEAAGERYRTAGARIGSF